MSMEFGLSPVGKKTELGVSDQGAEDNIWT
jgi:hypothetical protein